MPENGQLLEATHKRLVKAERQIQAVLADVKTMIYARRLSSDPDLASALDETRDRMQADKPFEDTAPAKERVEQILSERSKRPAP